jgi:hypothetical protein
VYCPFPGFIDHGKILLVGEMGLYEYRPYVRYNSFHFYPYCYDPFQIALKSHFL